MLDLPLVLDRATNTPLASQLAEQIRSITLLGHVRVGDRLPSTRALATGLGVSRTVTAAAYDQLHAEGWITGRHGSGTFVAAAPPGSLDGPAAAPDADELADDSVESLRPGRPWAAGIKRDVWRRAWRVASDVEPDAAPVRAGLVEYRAAIADHMLRHRGLQAGPRQVLATAGTTAAVREIALALFSPGDAVAVEEPGYQRAVGALSSAGVDVQPVPVDDDGLIVAAVPAGVRAVYCTPARQFPLGSRLSASRRVELVELARTSGAWIIEDDYDGELRYDVAPLPLLASVGSEVVIHLGTSSKIVSPTLGVGWMVAPAEVTSAVLGLRTTSGTSPSVAGQRVFTALMSSGDLSRHLRGVRKELATRREEVVSLLAAAGRSVLGDEAGAHVVVPVPDVRTERDLIARAREAGIGLDGLEQCFAGEPTLAGITLGYAAPSTRTELLAALAEVVDIIRRWSD